MVELEKVGKSYQMGENVVHALRDINFRAAQGEFIALVGPSGSGKSTLLHIIGGLDHPSYGRVAVGGRELGKLNDRELARYRNEHVGFVFQTFNLYPTYDAMENVALPLVFARIPAAERVQRAREALEQVGLGHRLSHRPNQLSGGERQRVSIARALVVRPRMILADEPTGNLDTQSGHSVLEILAQLNRERGILLLLVTHDREIASRAPRVVTMRDGNIVDGLKKA